VENIPADFSGLILSNELVDAFPVHRVVMRNGELRELYVTTDFTFEAGPLSTPDLQAYFERLSITLAEEQIAEVNLAAVAWMRDVARALARGFVLTVDFGHLAKELFQPQRRHGSLLAYYRQTVSDDLLARLGRQDLFAQVDFSTLVAAGKEEGLTPLGLVAQHHALLDLGLEGWLVDADPRNRRALLELVRTGENGLGDAKVLAQAKGVDGDLDILKPAMRKVNAERLRDIAAPIL
jgi:SAM-dependent MidA family methyltransferase